MSNKTLDEFILDWSESAELFVREALGVELITKQQQRALTEITKLVDARIKRKCAPASCTDEDIMYCKKMGLSIMAAKGLGKSAFESWITLWFLCCFPNSKVPSTAPTSHHLKDVLWSEIRKWIKTGDNANHGLLSKLVDWQGTTVKQIDGNGFASARTCAVNGTPDEQAETLAGRHEDFMLINIDEGCFDKETEILTKNGWRYFKDINNNDMVISMDKYTHKAFYEKPRALIKYRHKGKMIYYKSKTADLCITKNHNMYYQNNYQSKKTLKRVFSKWKLDEYRNIKNTNKIFAKKHIEWIGNEEEYFISEKIKIKMDSWLDFLGWYLSEGSITEKNNTIFISQHKKENIEKIKTSLERCGFKNIHQAVGGFYFTDRIIKNELIKYGKGCLNLKAPSYIKELSPRQINIFLNSFLLGDGYIHNGSRVFYTSSKQLSNDLHELCLLSGKPASLSIRKIKGQRKWIKDHWATSSCDGYVIRESSLINSKHLTINRKKAIEIDYDDFVYCVNVPTSHLIFTRRNGKCLWTGNSGVPEAVFRPLETTMTGFCNVVVMSFNPTRTTGYAIDTHTKHKEHWITLHWDAEDCPELVSQDHIERMRKKYGPNSNMYRINVKGLPPKSEENVLIPLDWVLNAVNREDVNWNKDMAIIGSSDIGAGSDITTLGFRQGFKLLEPILTYDNADTMRTAEWLAGHIHNERPKYFLSDMVGVGQGVHDRLREFDLPSQIMGFKGSNKPRDSERFDYIIDELWWKLRELFEKGLISIPDDDELITELTNRRYSILPTGKIKLETKREMKSRGIRSPNKADMLAQSFYIQDDLYDATNKSDKYTRGKNKVQERIGGDLGWMAN